MMPSRGDLFSALAAVGPVHPGSFAVLACPSRFLCFSSFALHIDHDVVLEPAPVPLGRHKIDARPIRFSGTGSLAAVFL